MYFAFISIVSILHAPIIYFKTIMNYKFLNTIILLCALLPNLASATTIALDGVWENYTLGTSGSWSLNYQSDILNSKLEIDFDGDFLGNGTDPELLTLIGSTDINTRLVTVDHSSFGNVNKPVCIPRKSMGARGDGWH